MNNIGIITCFNESKICSSYGCFKAFNDRNASFKDYDLNSEIICFIHCNGCSENSLEQMLHRANQMKNRGVDTIHISTCIKINCKMYNDFIKLLSKEFNIIGYTHD
ncbi:CGGC domain-containing protein [Clostridium sp. 'White wine YQ']|uniref:CGGC domain-containing protein n=1 Tax=Clostridium sp. 'White wine YQ' TaxID=3027474 RepID=UPI002366E2CA|nr:CGGC domain-containing protein [Clostridium sp. 'White wine YQ']MDD7794321.1 CGGC domain-containing protein [Clostridium sp. 'White wine YQ']